MDLKTQEIKDKRGPKEDVSSGSPEASRKSTFVAAFTINFFRFEVHFSFSVWVLRRGSISGHIWYGSHEPVYTNTKTEYASATASFSSPVWRAEKGSRFRAEPPFAPNARFCAKREMSY